MDVLVNLYKDDKISFHIGEKYTYIDEKDHKLVTGDIICFDNVKVGTLQGYLIYSDSSFYDVCSDISDDMKLIADVVCDKDGSVKMTYRSTVSFNSCVFVLIDINIDTKYRNLGIGSQVFKHLSKMIHIQFDVDTIILQANAYEYFADEEIHQLNTARLVKFYKRCGFKHISNNIMFCKHNELNYSYK